MLFVKYREKTRKERERDVGELLCTQRLLHGQSNPSRETITDVAGEQSNVAVQQHAKLDGKA